MQVTVKTLVLICTALIINGCSSKIIMVPTGCNIQEVDKAVIDYKDKSTLLDEAKRCTRNYTAVKEENEILRKTIDACR